MLHFSFPERYSAVGYWGCAVWTTDFKLYVQGSKSRPNTGHLSSKSGQGSDDSCGLSFPTDSKVRSRSPSGPGPMKASGSS